MLLIRNEAGEKLVLEMPPPNEVFISVELKCAGADGMKLMWRR